MIGTSTSTTDVPLFLVLIFLFLFSILTSYLEKKAESDMSQPKSTSLAASYLGRH